MRTDEAAAALVRDHGPRLAELQRIIDYHQSLVRQGHFDYRAVVDAAKQEQQHLVEEYSPP